MKIFDLSLILNGFPLAQARAVLADILKVPESDFAGYNARRRQEIVRFHLENNAFYREIAKNYDGRWESLPVMRKEDYQRPLEERLSKGYDRKTVFLNKTSGSSGNPMLFARDKFAHALTWANIQRRFGWYGIDFNHSWQARFYGRTLDGIAGKKLQLKDFLSRRHRFDIFDLSDAALEKVVAKFRRKKFAYLNGYTSNIVQLAKYLRKRNVVLKQLCPTLKVCVTTSEMLLADDRALLEKWLGIPVVNEYGASELEVIAFESPEGFWAVNSETIFVEILDEQDQPVPTGEAGRIIVTSLYNKAHPFIRYEVGDYGRLDASGSEKTPILQELTGRTNDIAVLPSGRKPAGMTFYSITKKLFEDDGNVKEFTIRQTKLDTFEIDYTSERPLSESEMTRMDRIMTDYLEPGLTFTYRHLPFLQRSGSGKLKQFVSLISQE